MNHAKAVINITGKAVAPSLEEMIQGWAIHFMLHDRIREGGKQRYCVPLNN